MHNPRLAGGDESGTSLQKARTAHLTIAVPIAVLCAAQAVGFPSYTNSGCSKCPLQRYLRLLNE